MAKTDPQPGDTVAPPRTRRFIAAEPRSRIDAVSSNFTLSIEERLRAYAQGVPSYIRRRRRIEDLEERLIQKLAAAAAPVEAAASVEVSADIERLNDLIARHNRYYPIEANLPIDVRTGRVVERGVPWRPLPPATAAGLLARAGR